MGLFGRKKSKESIDRSMHQAEKIANGKGLTGRLMKGFIGSDNTAKIGTAMELAHARQRSAAMRAENCPTIEATVDEVGDTGQLINFDPVVNVIATPEEGGQIQIQTLVSKLQIPRQGDRILLMQNPQQPAQFVYGGLLR